MNKFIVTYKLKVQNNCTNWSAVIKYVSGTTNNNPTIWIPYQNQIFHAVINKTKILRLLHNTTKVNDLL